MSISHVHLKIHHTSLTISDVSPMLHTRTNIVSFVRKQNNNQLSAGGSSAVTYIFQELQYKMKLRGFAAFRASEWSKTPYPFYILRISSEYHSRCLNRYNIRPI